MMTEQTIPPAPPADDEEAKRGRGRPTIAELEARQAALAEREAELKAREMEVELAAAEANMALREAELMARQTSVAAARTGGVRVGTIRSEDITEPVRGRRYKGGMDMPNKFHVPPEQIPQGISYQWNNHTVFGQEQRSYSAFMEEQGWEPVPAGRHPHLAPKGVDGNSPIIVDGQILVQRPASWTNEALQEELDKARGEVRAKEDQLYGARPDTPMGRNLGVKKDFERPEAELPRAYQYETPGQGGGVAID